MLLHLSGNILRAIFPLSILLAFTTLHLRRRHKAPRKRRIGFFRYGPALGNALHKLHIFVDPGVRYVIAEKLDEHAEGDGENDPADPAKYFERQLRRIRRGEQLDRLTIRISGKE